MMKTNRTTYTLVVLFFASLMALWGLEYAGVRTAKEKMLRDSLIVPELLKTRPADIYKLSIERGKERMVFERRATGLGGWQMVAPVNVAAEAAPLETLVRNLIELRRSQDAGSMTGPPATFGLDQPEAVVQLWGNQNEDSATPGQPLATIEFGKTVRRLRYLRAGSGGPIDVADAKLLGAVDLPLADWRQKALLPVATFQIDSVSIKRGTKVIRVNRSLHGRFRLLEPNIAPAETSKVESMLAALAALRVSDGAKGFVANDVTDLKPYGLSPPSVTVELTMSDDKEKHVLLEVGKPVPDQPDRVYVRQGDQDDVVMVNAAPLEELPKSSVALRSQKVCEFEPVAVSEIRIKSPVSNFLIEKNATGWLQKEPTEEKADPVAVSELLKQLATLQTSEFLDPGKVRDPELNPPRVTIQIRETRVGRTAATTALNELVVDLHIGKLDQARKVFYAQLDRDEVILTVPDKLLQVLPRNAMAYRDRSIFTPSPSAVRKLIVTRAGRTDELVPEEGGKPNRWRMRRPVEAPADTRAISQVVAILSNLRVQDFIADSRKEPGKFGLDHPLLQVEWETDRTHRLTVGAQVPHEPSYYAVTDDNPSVFSLAAETLKPFEAEFREHVVVSFPPATAERLVLTWSRPNRTMAFRHRQPATRGQLEWVDDRGTDSAGLDLSALSPLIKALSHLETVRYTQYDGEIQPFTGLIHPRLTVTVKLGEREPDRVIRVGHPAAPGLMFAAEGTGPSGAVFLLPAASWESLIQSGQRLSPLPSDVFAPTTTSQPR